MIDGLPIERVALPRYTRLVSTARLRGPVLAPLVPPDELEALIEIEGATSQRLASQDRGMTGLSPNELVFGVPHAHFINAAFSYPRPGTYNRFNGPDRGAWYAAAELETAIAEVSFHMTRELEAIDCFEATVDYAELFASFAGDFLDLRNIETPLPCLSRDTTVAYAHGNAIAEAARAKGLNGIIYPSARHKGGTCLAALSPHAVQSVAQGDIYRLQWRGSATPTVSPIGNGAKSK